MNHRVLFYLLTLTLFFGSATFKPIQAKTCPCAVIPEEQVLKTAIETHYPVPLVESKLISSITRQSSSGIEQLLRNISFLFIRPEQKMDSLKSLLVFENHGLIQIDEDFKSILEVVSSGDKERIKNEISTDSLELLQNKSTAELMSLTTKGKALFKDKGFPIAERIEVQSIEEFTVPAHDRGLRVTFVTAQIRYIGLYEWATAFKDERATAETNQIVVKLFQTNKGWKVFEGAEIPFKTL